MNISALFLGLFYLAYRKMFLYAYGAWGFMVLVDVISIMVFKGVTSTSYLGVFIVLGFAANDIYFRHSLKKVKRIKRDDANSEEKWISIRKQGGTSLGHAILFIFVVVSSSFATAILEEKVYYDYAVPKFEKAVSLQESGETEEAMEIYQEIENRDFPIAGLYYNRSLIYAEKKEYDRALKSIETYLHFVPDNQSGLKLKEELENKLGASK